MKIVDVTLTLLMQHVSGFQTSPEVINKIKNVSQCLTDKRALTKSILDNKQEQVEKKISLTYEKNWKNGRCMIEKFTAKAKKTSFKEVFYIYMTFTTKSALFPW